MVVSSGGGFGLTFELFAKLVLKVGGVIPAPLIPTLIPIRRSRPTPPLHGRHPLFRTALLRRTAERRQRIRGADHPSLSLEDMARGCRKGQATTAAIRVVDELEGFEGDRGVGGEHCEKMGRLCE